MCISEKSTYSANNNVTSEHKVLFKQNYRSMNITGHQQWEGKLLADLPVDYKRITITRSMNATRINCIQTINITIVKDTPLVENKVRLQLPLIITSSPHSPTEEKKQLISLRKDTVVTTPSSPVTKHRPERNSQTKQPKTKKKPPPPILATDPALLETAKPVPDRLVEFNTPIPTRKTVPKLGVVGVMTGFTTLYNPWNNPAGPNWTSPRAVQPDFVGPTNPFENNANELPHPFIAPNTMTITPGLVPQGQYPSDKNPFL